MYRVCFRQWTSELIIIDIDYFKTTLLDFLNRDFILTVELRRIVYIVLLCSIFLLRWHFLVFLIVLCDWICDWVKVQSNRVQRQAIAKAFSSVVWWRQLLDYLWHLVKFVEFSSSDLNVSLMYVLILIGISFGDSNFFFLQLLFWILRCEITCRINLIERLRLFWSLFNIRL